MVSLSASNFVHRYGEDVHKWCAKVDFSPKLIGCEVLGGGWIMVIMKLLDESWQLLADTPNRDEFKKVVHEAIVCLHQGGEYEGEKKKKKVKKKEGKVKYPMFINTDPSSFSWTTPWRFRWCAHSN